MIVKVDMPVQNVKMWTNVRMVLIVDPILIAKILRVHLNVLARPVFIKAERSVSILMSVLKELTNVPQIPNVRTTLDHTNVNVIMDMMAKHA